MASLYIHIPFCKQNCYYCDFHFSTNTSYKDRMIAAICKEMELQKLYLENESIETIYFGGGTPSLLNPAEVDLIFESISNHFHVTASPEITLEANPDDLSPSKLADLFSLGINRLSIGIQTFHDQLLTLLNRAHTAEQANKAFAAARTTGFENISVDLIFSIPGQSMRMLASDLQNAIALNPEHISIYSLTIEEKTVFGNWHKKGKFETCSDENSAEQFDLIITELDKQGYDQYEISNFSKKGFHSRHNSGYWKDTPYLGLGPGAHSYNRDNRQYNVAQNHAYMKSLEQDIVPFELDALNAVEKANEYLLTTLRTKWGCDLAKLNKTFHYDLIGIQSKTLNRYLEQGLLLLNDNNLLLTRKGKFVADTIIGDLFQD